MTTSIYLDTNAIIDFVEQRHEGLENSFAEAEGNSIELRTSELTPAEALVRPLLRREDWLLQLYEGLLVEDRIVRMIPIDIDIPRRSAEIRATVGGKTPDGIHVATAISNGCRYLVSSDKRLRMPAGDIERIATDDIDVEKVKSWR